MTTMASTGMALRLTLSLWALALTLAYFVEALHMGTHRRGRQCALTALGVLAANLTRQCLLPKVSLPAGLDPAMAQALGRLPLALVAGALLALSAGAARGALSLWRDTHRRVTPGSVRSAVDALPLGVLYYHPSGLVKLVNTTMEQLSWALFGRSLTDGNAFWADACAQAGAAGTPEGVVTCPDGRAYLLRASVMAVAGEPLTEVVATEVTDEMAINAQLAAKNAELEDAGRQLAAWSAVAADAAAAREVVEAKARVHDAFGAASIACRRYLRLGGDETARDAMLAQWERAIAAMRARDARLEPQAEVALAGIHEAAESVGMRLEVTGELPHTPAAMRATTAAAMETLLNAVRHGHAHTLFLSCERAGGTVRVTITNDGTPPEADAREGGGLALVRAKVAEAGGTVHVTWQPRFVLECKLPDREEVGHGR